MTYCRSTLPDFDFGVIRYIKLVIADRTVSSLVLKIKIKGKQVDKIQC